MSKIKVGPALLILLALLIVFTLPPMVTASELLIEPSKCYVCHDVGMQNEHINEVKTLDCGECHSPYASQRPVHYLTDVELYNPVTCYNAGCHKGGMQAGKEVQTLDCGECHGPNKKRDVHRVADHQQLLAGCDSCHNSPASFNAYGGENHKQSCTACHTYPTIWP